jgi:hypothetical protein
VIRYRSLEIYNYKTLMSLRTRTRLMPERKAISFGTTFIGNAKIRGGIL